MKSATASVKLGVIDSNDVESVKQNNLVLFSQSNKGLKHDLESHSSNCSIREASALIYL